MFVNTLNYGGPVSSQKNANPVIPLIIREEVINMQVAVLATLALPSPTLNDFFVLLLSTCRKFWDITLTGPRLFPCRSPPIHY
jgi:hypothetical protein